MGLYKLTVFIQQAGLISKEKFEQLDKYRIRRNKTIHDLIKEIKNKEFDAELKAVCEQGNKIIDSEEFSKIGEMLDQMESEVLVEGNAHIEEIRSISAKTTPIKKKSLKNSRAKKK